MRFVGNASGGKELSLVSLVDFRSASSLDERTVLILLMFLLFFQLLQNLGV